MTREKKLKRAIIESMLELDDSFILYLSSKTNMLVSREEAVKIMGKILHPNLASLVSTKGLYANQRNIASEFIDRFEGPKDKVADTIYDVNDINADWTSVLSPKAVRFGEVRYESNRLQHILAWVLSELAYKYSESEVYAVAQSYKLGVYADLPAHLEQSGNYTVVYLSEMKYFLAIAPYDINIIDALKVLSKAFSEAIYLEF